MSPYGGWEWLVPEWATHLGMLSPSINATLKSVRTSVHLAPCLDSSGAYVTEVTRPQLALFPESPRGKKRGKRGRGGAELMQARHLKHF